MNRENYKEVLKILKRDRVYNYEIGVCDGFMVRARINIDNSGNRANCVLERIVSYIDAMLYDVDTHEPESVTDRFAFIFNDERYTLNMEYMTHDSEEKDWAYWETLKSRILNAQVIYIEYGFSTDGDYSHDLIDIGIKRMLDDVLADGKLADCVRVYIQIEVVDCGYSYNDGLDQHPKRYLWCNGMHNGEYICGEVPFVQDEHLIRSCSGWRESGEGTEEEGGVILRLHPRTSPALLERLRKAARNFANRVNCFMDICLNLEEHRHHCLEEAFYPINKAKPSVVDKIIDDKEQLNFPDLRAYFTPEEVHSLLERYSEITNTYTKYADPSYTADQLEKIKFTWALVIMEELECSGRMIEREYENSWSTPVYLGATEGFLKVFYKIPDALRARLFGYRDFEQKTDQFTGELHLLPAHDSSDSDSARYIYEHSGIGDISIADDKTYGSLWINGYFIRMDMAYLNGIEDVRLMCDFLNELKEIEQLAQKETGTPLSYQDLKWYYVSITDVWCRYLEEENVDTANISNEQCADMDVLTHFSRRELAQKMSEADYADMNQIYLDSQALNEGDSVYFESVNSDNWARLRFRLEDGKFIYEVASANQEGGQI